MSEKIEIQLDTFSIGLGALGGFIATLWSTAPLFLGTKAAIITQNQSLLIVVGLALGAVSVGYSAGIKEDKFLNKTSLYSGLAAFLIIGFIGLTITPLSSALAGSENQQELTGDNLRTATIKVEGMVCQGCKRTIKNYLESMDGTKRVDVTLSEKKAEVTYDSDKTSAEELVNAKVFRGAYSATLQEDKRFSG